MIKHSPLGLATGDELINEVMLLVWILLDEYGVGDVFEDGGITEFRAASTRSNRSMRS